MTSNEVREELRGDIEQLRRKAAFYESIRLMEAAKYARHLADNLELALTTLPADDDPEIS